ncbi:TIGR01777 family oxidoreductase [Dasania marina]|uniref:TIGR01777 family oxidoreductase n=1 Tax=Dasania marina TaxID=471499 RepID=UPI0030DBC115|tara:strand:- start:22607 stop:23506 length:900 start_codon:yes stop_codon:yes gene_type:complete
MNIVITGGTGFIGIALCRHYLQKHQDAVTLWVLSRQSSEQVKQLCGDAVLAISDMDALNQPIDIIINLAGEPIADKRWSATQKQRLLASRLNTTQQLIDYIACAKHKPRCLISGSAIGYYGDQGSSPLTEDSPPQDEFTHQLCSQWEACALQAQQYDVRVCLLRTGLVVGPDGGFLAKMRLPFQLGLGGRIGSGQQMMSWIHRDDLIAIIAFLAEQEQLEGAFNGTAPNPVSNQEFSKTLARLLHRPAVMPVFAWTLKLALGEMSRLLLTGQKVLPARLQQAGFSFKYPVLADALSASL